MGRLFETSKKSNNYGMEIFNLMSNLLHNCPSEKTYFLGNLVDSVKHPLFFVFQQDFRKYLDLIIDWMFSEDRIFYYLDIFQNIMFSNNPIEAPIENLEEKLDNSLSDFLPGFFNS